MKIEMKAVDTRTGGEQIVVVQDGGNVCAVTMTAENNSISLLPADWRRLLRIIEALLGTD